MENGRGSVGESRGYLVLRLYIHMEGRRCASSSSSRRRRLHPPSPSHSHSIDSPLVHFSLFLPLLPPGSRERFLARARFSRSPWVGSIATSADSASFFQYIPTRIPDPLGQRKGRARLKPVKWN